MHTRELRWAGAAAAGLRYLIVNFLGHVEIPPPLAAEWHEAAAPDVPEVRANGAVFVGDRHIGRISYVHNGTSSRMFLYCRLHQCYKCVPFSRNGYQSGAAKWLAKGLEPGVTSKAIHLQSFDAFVYNP